MTAHGITVHTVTLQLQYISKTNFLIKYFYVSQSTSGRYIVFYVVRVSLSNTHVLYTIQLGIERID